MRSRTIREGSVGLLALIGIALFGGIAVWLRGIEFGNQKYQIIVEFPSVNGIQVGEEVRYRGLKVGNIKAIEPGTNGVNVVLEISSSDLAIPKNVTIEANSSGLIGQKLINIVPQEELSAEALALNPNSRNCDPEVIICDGATLSGEPGLTLDDMLPLMYRMTTLYSDPRFFEQVNAAVVNTSVAADEIAELSRNLTSLSQNLQQEIGSFSAAADAVTNVADETSRQIGTTATQYSRTAEKIDLLATNVNELIGQNRTSLNQTLSNISTISERLETLVVSLDTTLESTDTEQLVNDLETLTANAAVASENLRDISATFSTPENMLVLQQTLDSARVTFANMQKITADLDEITGDPAFRTNIRELVNGLSSLVSSTEQLEREVQTSQVLEPLEGQLKPYLSDYAVLQQNQNGDRLQSEVDLPQVDDSNKKTNK